MVKIDIIKKIFLAFSYFKMMVIDQLEGNKAATRATVTDIDTGEFREAGLR